MYTMEVLAPAGNLDIFKSVIDAGADAVYFGGKLFSARAYADNFSLDDSKAAIEYAHIHNKKAYLTLNTLVKNIEWNKELFDYINYYYEYGLDGIIVQDIGVIKYIRDNFPKLNVHGSTQLAVCNSYGAKVMQDMGVTRIVPARELSLNEITKIHNECDIELEIFVHGALCYSYSGDCLFSSMVGGRSGNRGRCAQPCRLEYDLYEGNNPIKTNGSYILSLKDLCGINSLDKLYNAGVSSLKIEGRMKQKQYATGVVNMYRKYVDRLMENVVAGRTNYVIDKADEKLLFDFGNRCGFTDAYYQGSTDNMVTFTRPNHKSKPLDLSFDEDKLCVKCAFTAKINEPIKITLTYQDITVELIGATCEAASKKPVNTTDIDKRLKKTGSTSFIIADISYDIDDNIFIPLGEVNKLRREALDILRDKLTAPYKRNAVINDSAEYTFPISPYNAVSKLIIAVSSNDQLNALYDMDIPIDYDIVIPVTNPDLFSDITAIKSKCKASHYFAQLPIVLRDASATWLANHIDDLKQYDGYIASGYDTLSFIKNNDLNGTIIAGAHLYSFNNYAVNTLSELGVDILTAPLELNNKELAHRYNDNSILTIYGRYPMMITANCINKNCLGCNKSSKMLTLRDKKGHSFPVMNYCNMCYNVIYNNNPTNLINESDRIKSMGFAATQITLIDEDAVMSREVVQHYINSFIHNENVAIDNNYTKGHWNRGVE